MTARDLIFTQDGSYSAEEVRQMLAAIFGARLFTDLAPSGAPVVSAGGGHGVVGGDDFAVVEDGTPNMSVDVGPGMAIIRGTEQSDQGVYVVANDATVNVAITAADATNPRIDLIVGRAEDTEYSGSTSGAVIEAIDGTPAPSPSAPTPPENSLVLASVEVTALASAISNADITDLRTRAYALGGTAVVASSAVYPSPAFEGQRVYDLALQSEFVFNGLTWARTGGAVTAKATRTAGAVNVVGTGDFTADVDTGLDLTVAAAVGDEVGLSVLGNWNGSEAVLGYLDFVTRASGADVNFISSGTSTPASTGVMAWMAASGANLNGFGGEWLYTVQVGDIVNGEVTFRLRGKTSSLTSKSLGASASQPLRVQAVNYGPGA